MPKKIIGLFVIVSLIIGAIYLRVNDQKDSKQTRTFSNSNSQSNDASKNSKSKFDYKKYSLDDPNSTWVIINKTLQLNPVDYAPTDLTTPNVKLRLAKGSDEMKLRKQAADALEQLFSAAAKENLDLMLASGYRSYGLQKGVYARNVKELGQAKADKESARPGYSEHQTGLALDVADAKQQCVIESCFGEIEEGKWVATNAYKYGFIVRYQKDQQDTVGYIYEPWHIRYVGVELSTEIHNQNNLPLETFFGLPAAPSYL